MLDVPVPGKRWRGRQQTRRKDSCKIDRESVGFKEKDSLDRKNRIMISNTIPATQVKGMAREEEGQCRLPYFFADCSVVNE